MAAALWANASGKAREKGKQMWNSESGVMSNLARLDGTLVLLL